MDCNQIWHPFIVIDCIEYVLLIVFSCYHLNLFRFGQLVPTYQSLQLGAALGMTRIGLLLNLLKQPLSAEEMEPDVISRQVRPWPLSLMKENVYVYAVNACHLCQLLKLRHFHIQVIQVSAWIVYCFDHILCMLILTSSTDYIWHDVCSLSVDVLAVINMQ